MVADPALYTPLITLAPAGLERLIPVHVADAEAEDGLVVLAPMLPVMVPTTTLLSAALIAALSEVATIDFCDAMEPLPGAAKVELPLQVMPFMTTVPVLGVGVKQTGTLYPSHINCMLVLELTAVTRLLIPFAVDTMLERFPPLIIRALVDASGIRVT